MSEAYMRRLNEALEGRYRVEREVGEGGMARVYLAEDLKHHRHVALKVLKPQLAAQIGAERFLAEIEVTANLQHPRILALYDSGEADGFLYYVMPFVEGESLRDRLSREHQLPVDEAVSIASAVAGALEHAHGHGVVHRDIKPANILIQAGEPVVADFGIALAVGAGAGERLTETGASVGTAHYMSPEQASGDWFVGPATDIYALGCVLYEMLVGEPPYTGASTQAILGKIIASQPVPVIDERPAVPAHVDAVIRRALEKLPADRFGSAADVASALKDESFRHGSHSSRKPGPWKAVALAALATVAALLMVLAWGWNRPEDSGAEAATRVRIAMAEGQELLGDLAISPDGSTWAYVGPGEDANRLWVKRQAESQAFPLVGTEGARYPFFSPDGQWIGFVVGGNLRKIGIDGSGAVTLSDAAVPAGLAHFGAAWLPDGHILFPGRGDALRSVPDVGGAAEAILTPDDLPERARVHQVHPTTDDRYVLLTTTPPGAGVHSIWLLHIAERTAQLLVTGAWAIGMSPAGHLLYRNARGEVFAARLNPGPDAAIGPAVPVAEGAGTPAAWSPAGVLLYREAAEEGTRTLVRVSRDGSSQEIVDPPWGENLQSIALSPDGRQLAVAIRNEAGEDLWVKQLDRGPATRLTSSPGLDRRPSWSSDGTRVLFPSDRGETRSLYAMRADGVGEAELVLAVDAQIDQGLWSPDGEWLIYRVGATAGVRDIFARRLSGDSATIAVSADPEVDEDSPAISPDGRWIAYVSNESGTPEVYVRPFPNTQNQRLQVSFGGAVAPAWAPDGDQLYYVRREANGQSNLVSASVTTGSSFSVDSTVALLPRGNFILDNRHARYVVTPDGDQFLLVRQEEAGGTRRDLVLTEGLLGELEEKTRD
jgi:serine/threonine-protein kinase